MVSAGEKAQITWKTFILMLRQVYKRKPIKVSGDATDIPNFIVETESRRRNSFFSRLPDDIIAYLKPYVIFAVTPQLRLCEMADERVEYLTCRRILRSGTFTKIMNWPSGALDAPWYGRVCYFSTCENERGVRFILLERNERALRYLQGLMAISARTVENLSSRVNVRIMRYEENTLKTFIVITIAPPTKGGEWPDRELYWSCLYKRRQVLQEIEKQESPMKKQMLVFNISRSH